MYNVSTVAHPFMRTENRADLEMRCIFCFENTAICDAIHAVLIENGKVAKLQVATAERSVPHDGRWQVAADGGHYVCDVGTSPTIASWQVWWQV